MSATPTTKQTPALTTLFEQPTDCRSIYTLSNSTIDYRDGTLTSLSYFVSDAADAKYTSCQPSGWDENNRTFSPAVCPSGWVYFDGVERTIGGRQSTTRTTAACCAR